MKSLVVMSIRYKSYKKYFINAQPSARYCNGIRREVNGSCHQGLKIIFLKDSNADMKELRNQAGQRVN